MPTSVTPHAVVLTAPDGCTKYLADAVERSLEHMDHGAVLEVPCDPLAGIDIAEWCLNAGKKLLNPFDGWGNSLLIENSRSEIPQAA